MPADPQLVRLVTYVDQDTARAMRDLAQQNGRSGAGELRVAVLRYIEDETVEGHELLEVRA